MNPERILMKEKRKANKPLLERKRRARINDSLSDLKQLVLASLNKDASKFAKMEKVDILDMTVQFLRRKCAEPREADFSQVHYSRGYCHGLKEVYKSIITMDGVDEWTKRKIISKISSKSNSPPPSPDNITSSSVKTAPPHIASPSHITPPSHIVSPSHIPSPPHITSSPQITSPPHISSPTHITPPPHIISPPHITSPSNITSPHITTPSYLSKPQLITTTPHIVTTQINSGISSRSMAMTCRQHELQTKLIYPQCFTRTESEMIHTGSINKSSNQSSDHVWRPW